MSNSTHEKWMVSAELREGLNGRKPQEIPAHKHTGLVGDETIRRLLNLLVTNYDPVIAAEQYESLSPEDMPSQVEATQLFSKLLRNEGTETLTRAIHNEDALTQSAAIGDPGSRSDISGLRAIEQLIEILAIPAPIIYIFGEPGSGKTNFALLCAQLWKREHGDAARLISNIRTWEQADEWVPSYGRLRQLIDDQTETISGGGITAKADSDPMLFVFDEASSHASGRGKAGYEAGEKLGPLVYKIRKARAGMIIIGHDGKDVHPAVRTLATVVQRYRGEVKRATLYEDVKDRQGVGKMMEVNGIPQTDYVYDDLEATSWSWDDHATEEDRVNSEAQEIAQDLAEEIAEERSLNWAAELAEIEEMDKSQRVDFGCSIYLNETIDHSQTDIAYALGITQSSISTKLRRRRERGS